LLDGGAFTRLTQFFLDHGNVAVAVVAHIELAAFVIRVKHAYFDHFTTSGDCASLATRDPNIDMPTAINSLWRACLPGPLHGGRRSGLLPHGHMTGSY
jgi:hypothetical protein